MPGSLICWRALGGARFLFRHTSVLSPGSPAERGFARRTRSLGAGGAVSSPSPRRLPFAFSLSPPLGPLPRSITSISDGRGGAPASVDQIWPGGRLFRGNVRPVLLVAGGLSGPACLRPSSPERHQGQRCSVPTRRLLDPLCAADVSEARRI